jgi:hypothetical protein
VYTSSRLLLFVVTAVVLGLLGMRGVLLLCAALLLSGLLSFVLLSKQRDAVAASVSGRTARMRARMEERTTAEDVDDGPAEAADAEQSGAEGEADGESDGVGELGAAGVAQHREQGASDGAVDHPPHRDDGQG